MEGMQMFSQLRSGFSSHPIDITLRREKMCNPTLRFPRHHIRNKKSDKDSLLVLCTVHLGTPTIHVGGH